MEKAHVAAGVVHIVVSPPQMFGRYYTVLYVAAPNFWALLRSLARRRIKLYFYRSSDHRAFSMYENRSLRMLKNKNKKQKRPTEKILDYLMNE